MLENVKMCKFSFVGLVWLVYQYLCNRSPFFLPIRASQGAAILVCSLPMRSGKRLAYDVFDTSINHADLVHDVTDTDCRSQNGTTHGCVFVTFKRQFLTNQTINQLKIFFGVYFLSC